MKPYHTTIDADLLKLQTAYGNRMADAMQKRSLSFGELAQATGLSRSYLCRIRAGKRGVSPKTALILTRELGIATPGDVKEEALNAPGRLQKN